MKNELLDVSISTMVGNLPNIINYNNDAVSQEFDEIRVVTSDKPVVIADVSAPSVSSISAKFKTLELGGRDVSTRISNLDASVLALFRKTENITYGSPVNYASLNESKMRSTGDMVMGAKSAVSSEDKYFDFSKLFSVHNKGSVEGICVENLYLAKCYRNIAGIKIPLCVGSLSFGNVVKPVLYHDHIDVVEGKKIVQRVYVPLKNGIDGNSIVQDGSAVTIVLGQQN